MNRVGVISLSLGGYGVYGVKVPEDENSIITF